MRAKVGVWTQLRRKIAERLHRLSTTEHDVHGLPLFVVWSPHHAIEPDAVAQRLDRALALIERYQPLKYHRLLSDFTQFLVRRNPTRAMYYMNTGTCLLELTFVGDGSYSEAEIAAAVIHEGIHARLHKMGCQTSDETRARHERLCRKAEMAFAKAIPDGQKIYDRAASVLDASDEEVAFDIDWDEAWRNVRLGDLQSMSAPRWLKRWIARRAGIDPSIILDKAD